MKLSTKDQGIITKLSAGGRSFEAASMELFHAYKGYIPTIKKKLKLSQIDVQDAYADAIVKLIRHIKDGTFRGESQLSTYFYRIFYNTAVDVSRKLTSNKNIVTEELLEYNAKERDLLKFMDNKEEASHIIKFIDEMSDSCKRILMDWAYYGYSMEEIAKRSELSNAESARSMKYKCLKKLRVVLSEQTKENE